MLCQKCKKAEAVVHLTIVSGGRGRVRKQNLCESWYHNTRISKKIATAGWTRYDPTKIFHPDNEPCT